MALTSLRHRKAGPYAQFLPVSCLAIAVIVGHPARLSANETDQFLLPTDKSFADLGPCISRAHYVVLEEVLNDVNGRIADAQRLRDPVMRHHRVRRLQDAKALADGVRARFGPGFFETIGIENAAYSKLARDLYGEQIAAYKDAGWIYSFAHLPIDPRNLPLLVQSSTIKVYGTYLGTDKLGHFHDLGHYYFYDYQAGLREGLTSDEAVARAVRANTVNVISERGAIGLAATGVCSNADAVANYMGLKFYRNLAEPVMLQGEVSPPICVLVGGYWQFNRHVRPDTDFMRPFFSDHWNEALNPSIYEAGMRSNIRKRLEKEADRVVTFYTANDNRPHSAEYFANLAKELQTYYGENYGYVGRDEECLTISSACFPALTDTAHAATPASAGPATPGG